MDFFNTLQDTMLFRFVKRIFSSFEEAVFPHTCGICRAENSPLCPSCFQALSAARRHSQVCGYCGTRETPLGALCFSCAGTAAHDGIFAALRYDDPRVARVIHLFKYRFIRDLGTPLGTLLGSALLQSELPFPDALLPVPLHPRRERWRGWNQSDILAEALHKSFPEDIAPPLIRNRLIRTRHTTPQMSIRDKTLRKENMENAFQVSTTDANDGDSFDIVGKNLWIIDDVAASGATIAACAKVLKEHGAREVSGIVVAR
jgi:competence protein ComFC